MKKLLILCIILIPLTVSLAGCGKSAYMDQQLSAYNNNMAVYQQATAAMASQPPMVSVSFHPDGRLASMQVAQRIEYPNLPAFRPSAHPGWALGTAGIRAAGVVGGIFAGGWAVSELAGVMADNAGQHFSGDVVNSFNPDNLGNIGSQGNFAPNGQFAGGDGIFYPNLNIGEGNTAIQLPIQNQEPLIEDLIDINPPEAEPLGVQYGTIKLDPQ